MGTLTCCPPAATHLCPQGSLPQTQSTFWAGGGHQGPSSKPRMDPGGGQEKGRRGKRIPKAKVSKCWAGGQCLYPSYLTGQVPGAGEGKAPDESTLTLGVHNTDEPKLPREWAPKVVFFSQQATTLSSKACHQ